MSKSIGVSGETPKSFLVVLDQVNSRVENSKSQVPTPDPSTPLRTFWSSGS